jgi:RHS repeat-associated protein
LGEESLDVSGGGAGSYDAIGRLFQLNGTATARFAYDGLDLIAEYDGAGAILKRYVHGPGIDEPLLEYACPEPCRGDGDGTTAKRWLHADERGSIVAMSDAAGNASAINRYDEYGKPEAGNEGRFQYTGQTWLPEVGLYYYKARMYSPALGRFLQTDPIGVAGGINLYAYVENDPVNYVDPLGLQEEVVEIVVTGTRVRVNAPQPGGANIWARGGSPDGNAGDGGGGQRILPGECEPGNEVEGCTITVTGRQPTPARSPSRGRSPPAYNPSENYCGGGNGLRAPNGNWNGACYNHDICYGTISASKGSCDFTLFLEIYNICRSNYSDRFCTAVSIYYYRAVDRFGKEFFNPRFWRIP